MREGTSKTAFAKTISTSRTHLYYRHRQPEKDWKLKQQIEEVLHEHPSYGHKRLALHLHLNKKRIRRVMNEQGGLEKGADTVGQPPSKF